MTKHITPDFMHEVFAPSIGEADPHAVLRLVETNQNMSLLTALTYRDQSLPDDVRVAVSPDFYLKAKRCAAEYAICLDRGSQGLNNWVNRAPNGVTWPFHMPMAIYLHHGLNGAGVADSQNYPLNKDYFLPDGKHNGSPHFLFETDGDRALDRLHLMGDMIENLAPLQLVRAEAISRHVLGYQNGWVQPHVLSFALDLSLSKWKALDRMRIGKWLPPMVDIALQKLTEAQISSGVALDSEHLYFTKGQLRL